MKKLLLIIISILFLTNLYADEQTDPTLFQEELVYQFKAGQYYLAPLTSSGINLKDNKTFVDREDLENSSPTWKPSGQNVGDKEYYHDETIVLMGGYADKATGDNALELNQSLRNQLEGGYLVVTAQSDTGALEMVSQANDAYRRPFKLWLISKVTTHKARDGKANTLLFTGIKEVNDPIYIPIKDPKGAESAFTTESEPESGSSVYFDLLLALPGEFQEGTLNLQYNGRDYMLAQSDDYVAMVTLTIQLKDKNGNDLGPGKSITLPFSGYITDEDNFKPSKASLLVDMLPRASVLNLGKDAGQHIEIAHLNFVANYGRKTINQNATMSIFLSSSSNPEIKGDEFRFVKTGSEIVTSANSLGFSLFMVTPDKEEIKFDGTSFLDRNTGIQGESVTIKHQTAQIIHSDDSTVYFFSHESPIYIEIEEPPASRLLSGLYREDIYVHVISNGV